MQDLKTSQARKKPKTYTNQNPIEALASVGTSVIDSAKYDIGKAGINEAWDELLGKDHDQSTKGHGDLSEGAELNLEAIEQKSIEITDQGRQFRSEIIEAGKRANAENTQEVQVKMQEILIEIKKLSESSEELKEQVEVISLEQTGEDLGVYHVNFLEKMLSYINNLRLNVEDSLSWFTSLRSKKAARQYGSMAKKHGTSFTLSGERQVSTQVG